ncbi:MAG: hypothetical protein H7Y03_02455 [Chitinophagaceae bacterium]|nr:hypothetical protein [Chitinophagaceae bacterium]
MTLKNFPGLLLIAFALLTSSCKKDNEDKKENYYVKIKIDGTWVTWTKVAGELGQDLGDATKTNLTIAGSDDASKTVFDFSLQVEDTKISIGTYKSVDYFMPISYVTGAGTSDPTFYTDSYIDSGGDSEYTLTLTSITDKTVSGKFTGNFLVDLNNEKTIDITEGEFVVPRIR